MKGDELQAKWNGLSEEIMQGIAEWREQHPKATFREIEGEIDKRLSALRAKMISDTAMASVQASWKTSSRNLRSKEKEVLELRDLEGVHLYDRARLLEEGIENIENLAHHNMIELIARTRIPTSRLVDMFDQAVLYLHLGLQEEKNKAFFATLKSHGIRTATDLDFALGTKAAYSALKKIEPPLPLDQMEVIFQTMLDDDWYQYIVQWRHSSGTRKPVITDPYQFYFPARDAAPPPAPAETLPAPAEAAG